MILPAFTTAQHGLLWFGIALAVTAIVSQTRGKAGTAIVLLTGAALVLRLFAAWLDPFLNDWDEVYHAVVAKNLMAHPLTPMLYRENALPITTLWSEQHIWLHKPPFFLWQIALSLKVFGLHPWAVRLPSVLLMTALVPLVWRVGWLMRDRTTGFAAAWVVTFAYAVQELTAGSLNTDHNDAVFIAVVACSWWAWLEHVRTRSRRWAVLSGVFVSAAVLTKWYVGACVFLPWFLWTFAGPGWCVRSKMMLLAAGVAAVPMSVWLFHILRTFPAEAHYEWAFKARHFAEPMDGHSGNAMFHLNVIAELVPPFTWWIVAPALIWLVWRMNEPAHRILVVASVLAIQLFFLFAQTKMVCYTLVLLPLYGIAVGHAVVSIVEGIRHVRVQQWVLGGGLLIASWFTLDIERIHMRHTLSEGPGADTRWRTQNLSTLEELAKLHRFVSRAEQPIVFNVPRNHHLRFMFTYPVEAWAKPPQADVVQRLVAKGYTVFVLQDGAPSDAFPNGTVLVPDSAVHFTRDVRL